MAFFDPVISAWRSAKERLTKPFLGSFIISWSLWNWRFIYLMINADKPAIDTIAALGSFLSTYSGIVYPLLTASLYCLIFPWIDFAISAWQRTPIRKRIIADIDAQIEVLNKKRELVILQCDVELLGPKKRTELEIQIQDARTRGELQKIEREHALDAVKLEHEARIAEQRYDQRRMDVDYNEQQHKAEYEESRRKLELDRMSLENDRMRLANQ